MARQCDVPHWDLCIVATADVNQFCHLDPCGPAPEGDGDEGQVGGSPPGHMTQEGWMHMTVPERTQALSLHRGPGLGSERTDDDIEGRGVIKLAGVTAGYGGEPVLSDVSLEINRGDFVCVEGPSGVGKTT